MIQVTWREAEVRHEQLSMDDRSFNSSILDDIYECIDNYCVFRNKCYLT